MSLVVLMLCAALFGLTVPFLVVFVDRCPGVTLLLVFALLLAAVIIV